MFLVTGATGNIGGELVRTLADSGEQVRALSRDGASKGLPDGIAQVAGDLNAPDSLRPALVGIRAMFLMPGYQDAARTLAYARELGVGHVVMLSGNSAGSGDTSNAVSAYMIEAETILKDSGINWTIIRPYGFMSNTLQWIPQLANGDEVTAAFANVAIAMIDPYDIAAVAKLALTETGHEGQIYHVTGPAPLRPADRVRILGTVLNRDLRIRPQPDDEARAEMSASMPQKYVDAFFSFYVDGTLDESTPLPTVAELTGRSPRTFERWAQEHVSAFT